MIFEHLFPRDVAELCGAPGGLDDVREQHRGQAPSGRVRNRPESIQECLNRVEHRTLWLGSHPVVGTRQLGVLRPRDERRGVTHQLERLSAAKSAVYDQGRHGDCRKHVADVECKAQLEQWPHRARPETCPLDLANPGDVSRIP